MMAVGRAFIDNAGNLLRGLDESELHALNAAGLHLSKHFTCIVARNHGKPTLLGSGTLVRVNARIFVATAKHLFEGLGDSELITVYWNERDRRAGIHRGQILEAAGDLDLAALPLDVEGADVGIPLDSVDTTGTPDASELFIISGVPSTGLVCDDASRTVVAPHWSLGLVALPPDSWPKLNPPLSPKTDMVFNYSACFALDANGEPMKAVDPHGLSGGGVWRIPVDDNGVWSPLKARLVAVQRSVESGNWKWLRATHIRDWVQMLSPGQRS